MIQRECKELKDKIYCPKIFEALSDFKQTEQVLRQNELPKPDTAR